MFTLPHTRLDRRTRHAAVGAAAIILGGILVASCSTGATTSLVDASRATVPVAPPTAAPVITTAAPAAPSSTVDLVDAVDAVDETVGGAGEVPLPSGTAPAEDGWVEPPVPDTEPDVPAPEDPPSDAPADPCDALAPDGPSLLVGPDPLVLDHGVMEGTITIVNCGDAEISWTAATKPSVSLDDDGASLLPGNTAELDFVIDAAAFEPGVIEFAIKVSEPGHNRYVDVRAFPQLGLTTNASIDGIQPCSELTLAAVSAPATC